MLRRLLKKCGYQSLGISTHSTRHTYLTEVAKNARDIRVLQQVSGHKDIKALSGYLHVTKETIDTVAASFDFQP